MPGFLVDGHIFLHLAVYIAGTAGYIYMPSRARRLMAARLALDPTQPCIHGHCCSGPARTLAQCARGCASIRIVRYGDVTQAPVEKASKYLMYL